MMQEIKDTLIQSYDKNTFHLSIPQCFDALYGVDAKFEMSASNTLQQLKLVYNHNIITRAIAMVFVFTYGYEKKNSSKKAEASRLLFKDLDFDQVEIYTDLSKGQVIEKLDLLQTSVDHFEEYNKSKGKLLVVVVSIGFGFWPETNE